MNVCSLLFFIKFLFLCDPFPVVLHVFKEVSTVALIEKPFLHLDVLLLLVMARGRFWRSASRMLDDRDVLRLRQHDGR